MIYSEEVIERFKAKIPTIKGDHTIYGITQVDIQCCDGSVKQIGDYFFYSHWAIKILTHFNIFFSFKVLLFERLRVDEPEIFLAKKKIYADVLIKINDKVLYGIIDFTPVQNFVT